MVCRYTGGTVNFQNEQPYVHPPLLHLGVHPEMLLRWTDREGYCTPHCTWVGLTVEKSTYVGMIAITSR